MTRFEGLLSLASALGLVATRYAPGDGMTRYRFFHEGTLGDEPLSYFDGRSVYTALGHKEARAFLAGYAACALHTTGSIRSKRTTTTKGS